MVAAVEPAFDSDRKKKFPRFRKYVFPTSITKIEKLRIPRGIMTSVTIANLKIKLIV